MLLSGDKSRYWDPKNTINSKLTKVGVTIFLLSGAVLESNFRTHLFKIQDIFHPIVDCI